MNKAAENIFVSQQSISSAIGQLEEEFCTPLVLRTNRGSFLTEAGQALCQAAQDFYGQCETIKEHFSGKIQHQTKLELIVEYSQLTIWDKLYTYYATHYPHIELERIIANYTDLEDMLEEYPERIVISYLHKDFLQRFQIKYKCHIIATDYLSLLVNNQSALAQNKSVSLKSVHNMKILFFTSKNEPTALTMLLDKYELKAQGNKYIYQMTHTLSNELGKHNDIICFAPKISAHTAYNSMTAVPLKEKLPIYLCAIANQKDVPPELLAALQNKNI